MSSRKSFMLAAAFMQVLALPATALMSAQGAPQAASAANAARAVGGSPIVIGQSHVLQSRVLGDNRRLNVWLPTSYDEGSKKYPVLVLLDGGLNEDFLHIAGLAQITSAYGQGRELIVVGVEGIDRRHDLSPPTDDPADLRHTKKPGGAERYRRFLAEEVKPWISARYRTDGRSAIIGESMAGLFVLDTLAATPNAFNDYIAVSPIIWWNKQSLSRRMAATPPATGPDRRLFIAFEGSLEPGPAGLTPAQQAEERLEAALRGRPNVTAIRFSEERHDAIYHPAALAAFRSLYAKSPPARTN